MNQMLIFSSTVIVLMVCAIGLFLHREINSRAAIARGNYASLTIKDTQVYYQHQVINKTIVDSKEYWEEIEKLGEILLGEVAWSDELVFVEEDMVQTHL